MPLSVLYPEIEASFDESVNIPITLEAPNIEVLVKEDKHVRSQSYTNRVGVNLPVDLDLQQNGSWKTLPNGDRICRLIIEVKTAMALGLYFKEKVNLPEGSTMYVFNQDKTKILGAFKDGNEGFKALEMIPGERLILEYSEKAGTQELPMVKISDVVFFYRQLDFYSEEANATEKAENCQVDVACSEGGPWLNQRRSTVFYTFVDGNGTSSCSAVMVNNTANDCKPYILSAGHCGFPEIGTDISTWVWYWNYEKTACQTGNGNLTDPNLPSTTLTGGTVISSALEGNLDNGLGTNELQGSDFVLIELNQRPPEQYNAFLIGWDRSSSEPSNGVSIHHPSGSAKKIATFINNNSDPIFTAIEWDNTSNGFGMMEPGSSGSPLFNQNGHLIGLCSWSIPSPCQPDQIDAFGKFSASWSSNGPNPEAQLAPWLDPNSSGTQVQIGRLNNCSNAAVAEIVLPEINVYPNPFYSEITIQSSDWNSFSISDLSGKELLIGSNTGSNTLDLINLIPGVYLLKLELELGQFKTFHIIKT